jgi:signal peptidase II
MTGKKNILWIVYLVVADQGIKLIIANYFIDIKFDIIENILGFRPIYNEQYSYFNALLKLNLGIFSHTILLIFIQFLILLFYRYLRTIQRSSKLLDISFVFGQSALICVFCGFFFGDAGILDFILLYPWVVDFKDIYLDCFVFFFLYNHHKNKVEIQFSNLKLMDYLRNIFTHIRRF